MQDALPALMLGGRNVMTSWTFEAPHAYLIEVSQVSDLCRQLQRAAPYCSVHLQGTFEKLPIQSANWSVLAWASVINNSVRRVFLAHCGMRSLLHRLRPHMAWPACAGFLFDDGSWQVHPTDVHVARPAARHRLLVLDED
jgi:hypothetical protein